LPCAECSGLAQGCQGSAEREILAGRILEATGKSSFFREDQHKPDLFLITQCTTGKDVNFFPHNLLLNQNLLAEMSYQLKSSGTASPLQSVLTTTSLPAQNKEYN